MRKVKSAIITILLMITIFASIFCFNISVQANENGKTEELTETKKEKVTFDKTVGINAFIDDPIDILKVAGTIREYHNFSWTLEKENENKFNPSNVSVWNFDEYYKKLYEAGITTLPCIQGTSKAIVSNMTSRNQKPVAEGADTLDPESYKAHASTMFQYAARYGKQEVEESKLLLASDQPKVSGLGYIEYYENWNEPDKTWEGEKSYFSPEEFAAMCSADYDGHEKALGDTYGIKNADPDAKLVMGGVGPSTLINYLNVMKVWAEENRSDKEMPIDVINFHMYTGKECPENSNFEETCRNITSWRDENTPEKEVWLTEFGWDTNINSAHGTTEENQKNWLIRTYLIANAAGIDRSTMYMSRDAGDVNDTGNYATSGLTTKKDSWNKKSSWYGVYTLRNTLEGFSFEEIVKQESNIYIYKFINKELNEECYVLWSPTSDGSSINDYIFDISGQNAKLTTIKELSIEGETTDLEVIDGQVKVNVTEEPIFIKVSNDENEEKFLNFKVDLKSDQNTLNPGDTITITASISEMERNNVNGLMAIGGKLEYDKDILEIDLDSITGLGLWNMSKVDYNINNYRFVTSSSSYVGDAGEIFKVNFKVKEDITAEETILKLVDVEGGTGEDIGGIIYTDNIEFKININQTNDYITSEKYKIEENYITRILPNTTVSDFKENVETESELVFETIDGKILKDTDIITTGTKLYVGKTLEYELVVMGDIDGDGVISINDVARIKLHYIGKNVLEGSYYEAAKLDIEGEVGIDNVARMKLIFIGKEELN